MLGSLSNISAYFLRYRGTKVYVGLRSDRSEVAIKRMDPDVYSERELNTLISCTSSSHVIHYYDVIEDEDFLYLITGLCEWNLSDYISQELTYQDQLKMAKQLIDGITALHSQGIVHRDLKVL